ncbi:NAD(P)-dependent oxidoreductase [Clostridium sp. YIM B02551]|uniref:NAD-dependent epimerase/dehydratase family protein n=1 Tax=Clostridium sp. YIM B02551 TaxID=2910679 RepID=UPI001EEAA388|nr:NAD(P)-dependent oxidoreductase [Clostridium sp. YIM B02551]
MNRVLITGASGFVGACLTESLVQEGQEVAIVTRNIDNAWRLRKVINNVKIYNLDLCDEDSVKNMINDYKPDKIFNLATYGGYYFQNDTKKILENNIMGTVNLVNACLKLDFKSFINIGSSSEYGTKIDSMTENDILEPINVYGVSKAAATLYCRMIAENEKLPIASVRLFSPYGYYEDKSRLVSSSILSCIRNENPKLASREAVRDFIFIEDALDMMKKVSESENIYGKIYNCGTGKQHSIGDIVETIINISQKNLIPHWGKVEGRKSDTAKWEADMTLVKKELGWSPKFSLEQGIKKSYEWYKENIGLYTEE